MSLHVTSIYEVNFSSLGHALQNSPSAGSCSHGKELRGCFSLEMTVWGEPLSELGS